MYYWPEGKKLLFLKENATPEYWYRQWQTEDWKKKIAQSRNVNRWSRILKKYLPNKNSKVIEGGCGCGHLVDAMSYWGYQVIGVDIDPKTIAKIKEVSPNLDVRLGDVRALDFEDEYFDGYCSLGVIEHLWEGYDDILKEMKRVLKPGGYAFVSFPCISRMDQVKILFSGYNRFTRDNKPDDFFQFGLDIKSVKKDFERLGFQCIRTERHNGWGGLQRLFAACGQIYAIQARLSKRNKILELLLKAIGILLAPLCSHSAFMVLRKRQFHKQY